MAHDVLKGVQKSKYGEGYTPKDQTIMNSLKVVYSYVTIIRCKIDESLIKDLHCQFRNTQKTQHVNIRTFKVCET